MTQLLNLAEAARRLNVSCCTLRRLVRDGKVRPVKLLKGKLLFSESGLEEAVRAAEESAPAPAG
jgi:excisionase family DNA binding protein